MCVEVLINMVLNKARRGIGGVSIDLTIKLLS